MIRFSDAITLAYTKLRMRKLRTIVTATIASLLFGVLVVAIAVLTGIIDSAYRFTSGELTERYIVSVMDYGGSGFKDTPELRARATEIYTALVADKKAEATRLNISYDPTTEIRPITADTNGMPYIDLASPAAQQAIREQRQAQPTALEETKQLAGEYNPAAYYTFEQSSIDGNLKRMIDGKEVFDIIQYNNQNYSPQADITDGWAYLDGAVAAPFLLDDKLLAPYKNSNDLPIIAPYSKVEAALGLEPLPKTAEPTEKLDRIQYVRQHAADVTFTVCYRNHASQALIDQAIRVAEAKQQNKNNPQYQTPSLVYGLPDTSSCAAAPIIKDTRTAIEKDLATRQAEFARIFNQTSRPMQQKIVFRVVGVSPDVSSMGSFSTSTISALVHMVAGSSLQGQWVVPLDMYSQLPNKAIYEKFRQSDNSSEQARSFLGRTQLVEFSSATDAKAFVENESCNGPFCNGKPYMSYFGSNSVLIDDVTTNITKALRIAAIIVAAIAAIIMMGMVGRVITDSRRETAVFRAIGAKRNDIRAIYVIYTILFSLIIALIAITLGLIGALWIDATWSADATVTAQLAFVSAEDNETFHLFGVPYMALLGLSGLIIAVGLTSMLLPLSRNLARSPLKDMRDDQ